MTPRVAAMRFFRYGCSEQDHPLFQRAYARSNRMHGTKILRCFPHCCPDHVPRRYCGCSLHLVVEFDGPLRPDQEQQVVVCARFEAPQISTVEWRRGVSQASNSAVLLEEGSVVSLPRHLVAGEDDEATDQMWIRGVKESERRQEQAPRNAVVFALNNRRFPKWIYNYERDATKQQREMMHCLRAYVFVLQGNRVGNVEDRGCLATVVAHLASPGFILFSYRRAQEADRRVQSHQESLELATAASPQSVAVASNKSAYSWRSPSTINAIVDSDGVEVDYGKSNERTTETSSRKPDHSFRAASSQMPRRARLTRPIVPTWKASLAYEYRFVRGRSNEKLQHLRIIYLLLESLSSNWLLAFADSLTTSVRDEWLAPIFAALEPAVVDKYLSTFSLATVVARLSWCTPDQIDVKCPPVIIECVDAAMRAMNPSFVLEVLQAAMFARESISVNSSELLEVFADCVDQVYEALSFVIVQTQAVTLDSHTHISTAQLVGSFVDTVVAFICQEESLSPVRQIALDILRDVNIDARDIVLYRKALAQATELVITQNKKHRLKNETASGRPRNGSPRLVQVVEGGWWMLNTETFMATDRQSSQTAPAREGGWSLTALELLVFFHQWLCIDVSVDGPTLIVASVLAENIVAGSGMSLILDGRPRVFRAFPNGIVSIATSASDQEWAWGDYVGQVSENKRSLVLVLYSFKLLEIGELEMNGSGEGSMDDTTAIEVHEINVRAGFGSAEGAEEVELSDGLDNLVVSVEVHRAVCLQLPVKELRTIPCSRRQALFSQLDWAPLISFSVSYDRVRTSQMHTS